MVERVLAELGVSFSSRLPIGRSQAINYRRRVARDVVKALDVYAVKVELRDSAASDELHDCANYTATRGTDGIRRCASCSRTLDEHSDRTENR